MTTFTMALNTFRLPRWLLMGQTILGRLIQPNINGVQVWERWVVGGGPSGDGLLLESGDYVLLESGDFLLLE